MCEVGKRWRTRPKVEGVRRQTSEGEDPCGADEGVLVCP